MKLLIVSRKSKGGNVNIRSKVATGEQQRESQGRQKFNISLIISSLQSGRDRSATLKWKCTRSEPLLPSTGWRTALINIQNGTWNSATRETKDIPYRLFHGRNLPILSRRDALSRPLFLSLSVSLSLTSCFANYEFHFLSCLSRPPPSPFVLFLLVVASRTEPTAIIAIVAQKREGNFEAIRLPPMNEFAFVTDVTFLLLHNEIWKRKRVLFARMIKAGFP